MAASVATMLTRANTVQLQTALQFMGSIEGVPVMSSYTCCASVA